MMNRVRSLAYALVSVGVFAVPAHAQAVPDSTQARVTADTSAVRMPGLGSWTSDRRNYVVGDLITVLIDELTIASADKSNVDSQDRSTRGDVGGGFGSSGSGTSMSGTFRTGMSNDSRERGQARRSDRLTTEISVKVISVEPNGVLKVEGTRVMLIDKQEQKVTFTGLVRPQDVTPKNAVDSWRVADAQLAYSSEGSMGKPKRGILSKIVGIIWP
jgi:flagellar L-ring protein precursor FlgH